MNEANYFTETINHHSFRLCYLKGGLFDMGSSKNQHTILRSSPIHEVFLSPFYMAEFLVTQALWKTVIGTDNNPSRFRGDKRPVENVSWLDIVEGTDSQVSFLEQINDLTKDSRPDSFFYRLPTEAEWEYAARANENFAYAGSDHLKEVGWYRLNSHSETKEVGLKKPNAFGLYDMSGNVWEWCNDWYDVDYYEQCHQQGIVTNPRGPVEARHRVLRGGSWGNYPRYCRVSYRNYWPPSYRDDLIGFRLVLSPSLAER